MHSRGDDQPHIELFAYQSDPHETRNLLSDHPTVVDELLLQLQRLP